MRALSLGDAAPGQGTFAAILWKELREGFKWGALSFLVVAAALFGWVKLASDGTATPTGLFTMVSLLVAVLIGLAQTIPENRGDPWGFLVHRPPSRSLLFAGKLVAGFLLYGAATLGPLAVALIWVAIPGHRPMPFDVHLALPGIADFLCGMVYYFAALLIGMRDARWYASRALGIGVAIVCTVYCFSAAAFWQSALVSMLGVIVVGTAAWGTFIAGGRYEPQPKASRAALGFAVGSGLVIVGIIAVGILTIVLPGSTEPPREYAYEVSSGGQIVQTISVGGTVVELQDLDGHPFEQPKGRLTAGVESSGTVPLNPDGAYDFDLSYHGTDNFFVRLGQTSGPRPSVWYFIRRSGLIVGYDIQSHEILGWLGPAGFTAGPEPPPQKFEGKLFSFAANRSPLTVAFPNGVYRVALAQRSVVRLFAPAAGETVVGAAVSDQPFSTVDTIFRGTTAIVNTTGGGTMLPLRPGIERAPIFPLDSSAFFAAVATTSHVYVLGSNDLPQLIVPRDPRAAGYGGLTVSRALRAPGTPTFVTYEAADGTLSQNQWYRLPQQVTEFNGRDSAIARFTLPRRHSGSATPWVADVVLPSLATPLAAGVVSNLYDRVTGQPDSSGWSPSQETVAWILMIVASLVSAGATMALGRKHAFAPPRLWIWGLLGLALGLLGVLLMLSLMEWPAHEPCPACGRKRVVTRERCEHCGGTFAAPAADGTEIFEVVAAG